MQRQIHTPLRVARGGCSPVESRGWMGCGGGISADGPAGNARYIGAAPISRMSRGAQRGCRGPKPLGGIACQYGSLPLSSRGRSRRRAHSLCHRLPVAPERAGPLSLASRTARWPRRECRSISIRPRFVCAQVVGRAPCVRSDHPHSRPAREARRQFRRPPARSTPCRPHRQIVLSEVRLGSRAP